MPPHETVRQLVVLSNVRVCCSMDIHFAIVERNKHTRFAALKNATCGNNCADLWKISFLKRGKARLPRFILGILVGLRALGCSLAASGREAGNRKNSDPTSSVHTPNETQDQRPRELEMIFACSQS